MDDWTLLGQGTVAGHLLECAGQITGGYFADPGYKDVPDLARLGFPIGEVGEDGSLVITKVEGSGGAVTAQTCKEQLLYEMHDPTPLHAARCGRRFLAGEGRGDRTRPRARQRRTRQPAHRHAEGLGRLCRRLYRRGPDFLCRPRRIGARAAGAGDRARAAEAHRRCGQRIALRADRRRFPARSRKSPRTRTSLTKCAFASPAAPKICARPCDRQRGRNALHQRPGRRRRRLQIGARCRRGRIGLAAARTGEAINPVSWGRDETARDRPFPHRRQGQYLQHLRDRL